MESSRVKAAHALYDAFNAHDMDKIMSLLDPGIAWEAYGPDAPAAAAQPLSEVTVPVGFSSFPGEIWRTPRSWAEQSYPTLTYFGQAERGGHFAAWEEPELFAAEVRAAFRPLRAPGVPEPR